MKREAHEGAPTWLRRVRDVEEAAEVITEDGVLVVAFEPSRKIPRPDVRQMPVERYPFGDVLRYFPDYMKAKQGGYEGTIIDFFLANNAWTSAMDETEQGKVAREIDSSGDSKWLRESQHILEPVFVYVQARILEILEAFPDYELTQAPQVKGTGHVAPTDWHIDGKGGPPSPNVNVLINIYGTHTEYAVDIDGNELQTFEEGLTTVHRVGSGGAVHRAPLGKPERFLVTFVLRKKKKN